MNSTEKPNAHVRTRRDHASETAEDYVEAIQSLVTENGTCRVTDLAHHFAVSHVTVTRIVARLNREGLVETQPYGPISLTPAGESLASESQQRHQVVYAFLSALGVDERTAAIDTEGIEHHVSPATLAAMRRFVDNHSQKSLNTET